VRTTVVPEATSHEVFFGPKAQTANWLRKLSKPELYDRLEASDLDDSVFAILLHLGEEHSDRQQAKRFIMGTLLSERYTSSLKTRVAWSIGAHQFPAKTARMDGFANIGLETTALVGALFPDPNAVTGMSAYIAKVEALGVELPHALATAALIRPLNFETAYLAIANDVPVEYLHSL